MNCNHCNKDVNVNPEDDSRVIWCRECINQDWDLLESAGAITPPCPKYEFMPDYFTWYQSDSAKMIKQIPQRTLKNLEDVITIDSVPDNYLCKRIYYGIQCNCPACFEGSSLKIPELRMPFCKKRYYGIACDCGYCPERVRYRR